MLKKDMYKLDANESAFFKRELEFVKSKTYDTKYKSLKSFQLIPISNEAPNGATEITYRKFSGVGLAKIIADYANDFPRVDTFGEEVTQKVRSIGDSYGYSIAEIRRSQMVGRSLDQRRAGFARRAADQKIDSIAWNGDDNYNLLGLIDYPGITEYTVPNDGTGSSKTWTTKTPDQIIRDMEGLITAIVDTTNGVESPDTMIMPIAQYRYIKTTRMTDGDSNTILGFFMGNNPGFLVDWVTELKTAGAGSTARYMAYSRNADNLTLEIPQPFEQFPAQAKNMEFQIPCHASTGGVIVYYPLSVAFGDGI
jgi:hypothetical protein